MRPHNDFGRGVWPNVLFEGKQVAALPDSTYTFFLADPGTYAISTKKAQAVSGGWDIKGTVTVEAGNTYFLMLRRDTKAASTLIPVGSAYVPVTGAQVSWQGWVVLGPEDGVSVLSNLNFIKPDVEVLSK